MKWRENQKKILKIVDPHLTKISTRQALQSRKIEEFMPKKSKMAVFGQNKGNPMDKSE